MHDVVALSAELLGIPSSTGAEQGAVDFVSRWLVSRGWNVNLQEVTRGRANVWASRGGGNGVTLSTHLDTVPPYIPPTLKGDRLFGRGAADAKGIAAAMMVAADALAAEGETRVDLLLVVGELHDAVEQRRDLLRLQLRHQRVDVLEITRLTYLVSRHSK